MESDTLNRLFHTRWTGGQYGLVRLMVAFSLAAWSLSVLTQAGSYPALLGLAGLALALPVAIGWKGQEATGLAALLLTAGAPFLAGPHPSGAAPVVLLLVLHLLTPRAPVGTLDARARVDPGGGWRMPPGVYLLAWGALVLQLPEGTWPQTTPPATWWFLVVVIAALVPWRHFRPWLWLALFIVQATHPQASWTLPLAVLYLFTFDPGWVRPRRVRRPIRVFYDGDCRLCHGLTRLLVAEDVRQLLRFAPLSGPTADRLLNERVRQRFPESILVRLPSGEARAYSGGVLFLLECLGGLWRVLAILGRLVPVPVRDAGYQLVAHYRRRFTRQTDGPCPILPPRLASRFDP